MYVQLYPPYEAVFGSLEFKGDMEMVDVADWETVEEPRRTRCKIGKQQRPHVKHNALYNLPVVEADVEAGGVDDAGEEATGVDDVTEEATGVDDVAEEVTGVDDVAEEATEVDDVDEVATGVDEEAGEEAEGVEAVEEVVVEDADTEAPAKKPAMLNLVISA
jgi:hypothetical protein